MSLQNLYSPNPTDRLFGAREVPDKIFPEAITQEGAEREEVLRILHRNPTKQPLEIQEVPEGIAYPRFIELLAEQQALELSQLIAPPTNL